ncbi:hypothetical protein RJ640_023761 [Escallonia rubra]|uniref:protein-serine/threonine phosphatase n=1 Tax=Escallonia rubra TaxID=112253 RepID=A0AA88UWQ2_9ASTE|nr:hypothetical protein RJ640_023761 [Escallonia rubra]
MEQSHFSNIWNKWNKLRLPPSPPRNKVQLSESEIRQLCLRSKDIFLQQPNLLELEAPIKICGAAEVMVESAIEESS